MMKASFRDKIREKIADDCRRLRVERVVPLRQRLQAYKDQTEIFC